MENRVSLEINSALAPTPDENLVIEMTQPDSATLGDLSPLIANIENPEDSSNSSNSDGVTVPTSNRQKPKWFRQMSNSFSEGWSRHIGSIGYLGSVSIAVNSLTGPAMLNLPDTFQRAGFIPTTLTLVFVAILSSLCCLHMSNTISKVSGNGNFRKEIEYSETFEAFWGHKSFISTQILFYLCILCLNISSIVDTAQVVDTFLGHWFPGGSAALYMHWDGGPHAKFIRWDFHSCPREVLLEGDCVPFADDGDVGHHLTIGYVLTVLVFLPMALMDLKVCTVSATEFWLRSSP